MKKRVCIFLIWVATVTQPFCVAAENGSQAGEDRAKADHEIAEVIRFLGNDIALFNGTFEVEIFIEGQSEPETEKGTIAFKAPSFWRFEKYKPGIKTPAFVAGCNGKILWEIDGEGKNRNSIIKTDVQDFSDDQRKALMFQSTGISPFFLFSEEAMSITSVSENQDNAWVVEISTDKPVSPRIPFHINRMRFEISKETGLIKTGEYFNEDAPLVSEDEPLVSIKFQYT